MKLCNGRHTKMADCRFLYISPLTWVQNEWDLELPSNYSQILERRSSISRLEMYKLPCSGSITWPTFKLSMNTLWKFCVKTSPLQFFAFSWPTQLCGCRKSLSNMNFFTELEVAVRRIDTVVKIWGGVLCITFKHQQYQGKVVWQHFETTQLQVLVRYWWWTSWASGGRINIWYVWYRVWCIFGVWK